MSAQTITRTLAIAALLGIGLVSLSAAPKKGELHITKDCTGYQGQAGQTCRIESSSLAEILVDSKVVYDQGAGIPAGMLDSNVVLDAGNGDRAVGRCTLDFMTRAGLCTFSDGTGSLAGFSARVDVSHVAGDVWAWDGTYSFIPKAER